MTPQADLFKGLVWLGIAIASWGAHVFGGQAHAAGARCVLPRFGALRVRRADLHRHPLGVEGRQALRYGGRFLPAAVYGLIGFCGFNLLVWWGLAYTRPEHASIIMALQTPMTAIAVWLTQGKRPRRSPSAASRWRSAACCSW